MKEIGDNKRFWKSAEPYLSDKDNKSSKITLFQCNIFIADEKKSYRINEHMFCEHYKKLNLKAPVINKTDYI